MTILTPEQLTGRVDTHVQEVPQLCCSLQPQAARAFLAMTRQAAHMGIDLQAASAFRSFDRQLAIWNAKFGGQLPLRDHSGQPLQISAMSEAAIVSAILAWSALPGASRHHWGSEIDVFDRAALPPGTRPQLLPGEYAPDGVFARLAAFVAEHAARYGFFLPYDRDRGGVQPEPWHLSFAPLSCAALAALTPALLAEALQGAALAGAPTVARLLPQIHERYVRRVAAPPALALEPQF